MKHPVIVHGIVVHKDKDYAVCTLNKEDKYPAPVLAKIDKNTAKDLAAYLGSGHYIFGEAECYRYNERYYYTLTDYDILR